MSSSGVRAYIAQVDRLLAAGEGVFPRADGPGARPLNAGDSVSPATPPGASGMAVGASGVAQDYRGTWTKTTVLDDTANAAARAADAKRTERSERSLWGTPDRAVRGRGDRARNRQPRGG